MWSKRGNYTTVEDYIAAVTGQSLDEIKNPVKVSPYAIENIDKIAFELRLLAASEPKKPAYIVGDYDADGITSTAILTMLLEFFGVQATTIIPKRFTDGYGLNERMVESIRNSLIITVDNGIAAKDAIRKAKENGNRVLVIDHHIPESELPCADAICDPHVKPENSAFVDYCGAGLALKVAECMTKDICGKEAVDLMTNLTVLAAIGTLADAVPLLGDNRRIVMEGLKLINNEASYKVLRPGVRTLIKIKEDACDEDEIKFRIAPILNAPGRLYDAGSTSSLKAVLCKDETEAANYVEKMFQINETRKELVKQWQVTATEKAEAEKGNSALVLKIDGLPEGISGIIAGKLAEDYKKVTFIFAKTKNGTWKASGRSVPGVDLTPMLAQISGMTVACGGHAGAAGVTVTEENFDALKNAILDYMDFTPVPENDDTEKYDCEIKEDEIPQVLEQLKMYAPYGEGLKRPVFMIKEYKTALKFGSHYKALGSNGTHLKIFGSVADAIGFGLAEKYEALGRPTTVSLLGDVTENSFRGQKSPQFSIKDIEQGC